MREACLFCGIVAGDVPAQIVDSDEHTVAFMDINPATDGHALVVPRRHAADVLEIEPDELAHTIRAAKRLVEQMRQTLDPRPDGFNLINACGAAAWQTVFHLHVHVVPRWEGDPLELPWTPTPGDPDRIAATAAVIRADRGVS